MPKKPYESDTTSFIKSLFKKNPDLREKQLKARSIWWDRDQDLSERSELEKSQVIKKPYEYYWYVGLFYKTKSTNINVR